MSELGMAGGPSEVARAYTWRAPRWLPAGLVVGAVMWGAGIWWMVANLGGGIVANASGGADQAVSDEVAVLRAKVDSLTQQTTALTADRDALVKRVAAIEGRPTAAAATPAATSAPTTSLDDGSVEYSTPRVASRAGAEPSGAATSTGPTATAASRFFTSGADKYNCTSFTSQAEAQEALAANAPGDPNRMDMNANGVACEDIPYASNSARNVTPIANR